jgi:hypothetical protein
MEHTAVGLLPWDTLTWETLPRETLPWDTKPAVGRTLLWEQSG